MRLPPVLASLTRHKFTVALMLAAIALTCAVVINIASLIVDRISLLDAPSGVQESGVVLVDSSRIDTGSGDDKAPHPNYQAVYETDVVALRGITGVESAAVAFGLPLHGGTGFMISDKPDLGESAGFQASAFGGGPGMLKTLGLHLIQGRDFLSSEYLPFKDFDEVTSAIVSRALVDRLYHADDAVGRLFYSSGHPIRIVGVVDHLMGMSPQLGATDNEYAMLLPLEPGGDYVTFVLRAAPKDRDQVLKRAVGVLGDQDSMRILQNANTFTELRGEYFQRESAMVGLLLAAGFGLLIVTAAGIAGLASFWVRQRTRTIGIRRALGATRSDTLRYFQVENFLIVTGGALIGCLLAYALNLLLMKHYSLQTLHLGYFVVGVLALWVIGQIAVLGPALRAAAVPPVVATRSI